MPKEPGERSKEPIDKILRFDLVEHVLDHGYESWSAEREDAKVLLEQRDLCQQKIEVAEKILKMIEDELERRKEQGEK